VITVILYKRFIMAENNPFAKKDGEQIIGKPKDKLEPFEKGEDKAVEKPAPKVVKKLKTNPFEK
jgi:hypothetical protein